jgi:hypothetical protein
MPFAPLSGARLALAPWALRRNDKTLHRLAVFASTANGKPDAIRRQTSGHHDLAAETVARHEVSQLIELRMSRPT